MSQQQKHVAQNSSSKTKSLARRKIIQKVHKKTKRKQKSLQKMFSNVDNSGSALGSYGTDYHQQINEFDMKNVISMGHNRKIKKKMKKLQKKMGPNSDEQVFNAIQKYKQTITKSQEKIIFNPVNQLAKRRQRRLKKMDLNAKKGKSQVFHKKQRK